MLQVPRLVYAFMSLMAGGWLYGAQGCDTGGDETPTPSTTQPPGVPDPVCTSPCTEYNSQKTLYHLHVTADPSPPVSGYGEFTLWVADLKTGTPVEGATVEVTGFMDMGGGMGHGFPDNTTTVTEVGDGTYIANVIYSMSGDWEITVAVNSAAYGSDKAIFMVSVK